MPFKLSEAGEVKIRIYDLSGTLVNAFELGYMKAGSYIAQRRALHWDGRNEFGERVASGFYIYQLDAGDKSFVKRMVVLK